jgi:predicted short-subunit dehydrogenase-like oxidoreductase (DUF2520 family)
VKEYRISFIGAGKVSSALCRQLFLSGCKIQKIVSRTDINGPALAKSCNASWSDEFDFALADDVIITAVPDDALEGVLGKIKCHDGTLVVHTAGSIGLDVFPPNLKHTGVFYPLQTFSEKRNIDFKDLPFFLEASEPQSSAILKELAELTGGKPYFVDSEQRKRLHVAAVFVSNFVNHMLTSGKQIAEKAGLQFEVLIPLINETFKKAIEKGPENSQTGPAYRNDTGTIKKHIELLSFSPELQNVYKEVTKSIINSYKNRR